LGVLTQALSWISTLIARVTSDRQQFLFRQIVVGQASWSAGSRAGDLPHFFKMRTAIGQEWFAFDPRYNLPRIGRVKMAHRSDAVDRAFATIYGEATLTFFEVRACQVNPQQVLAGDPIDLSKRLDGVAKILRS
jgi:hypothetical protein